MALTLLPGITIISFIHSLGLFPGQLLGRLLKGRAVAWVQPRPSGSQGCVPWHCPTLGCPQKGRVGNTGLISNAGEEADGTHTYFSPAWDLSKANQENSIKVIPDTGRNLALKSKAYSKACPFHSSLKTTVENSFFAANRINNVIHKCSRISFSLIQLGANCQQENFQLS